jgi:hypothetical protein
MHGQKVRKALSKMVAGLARGCAEQHAHAHECTDAAVATVAVLAQLLCALFQQLTNQQSIDVALVAMRSSKQCIMLSLTTK